eukprot:1759229-Amphidinium_carterae.1
MIARNEQQPERLQPLAALRQPAASLHVLPPPEFERNSLASSTDGRDQATMLSRSTCACCSAARRAAWQAYMSEAIQKQPAPTERCTWDA